MGIVRDEEFYHLKFRWMCAWRILEIGLLLSTIKWVDTGQKWGTCLNGKAVKGKIEFFVGGNFCSLNAL